MGILRIGLRGKEKLLIRKLYICIPIGLYFIFLSAIDVSAAASAASDEKEDYGPIKLYEVSAIKSVVLENMGMWTDEEYSDETPEVCAKFKLKNGDVSDFFRLARQIDYEMFRVHYLASRCYATGKIVFANGDQGSWKIDFERRGVLKLSDGRKLFFFCSKCKSKAFYP
jgi:hypothetical protein